jgi:hypothetical protein
MIESKYGETTVRVHLDDTVCIQQSTKTRIDTIFIERSLIPELIKELEEVGK